MPEYRYGFHGAHTRLKIINHTSALLLFLSLGGGALAADVNLNGVLGNKALLVIDNGKPRWLATGETSPEGIKLISISGEIGRASCRERV